jgi:hypothetical protein
MLRLIRHAESTWNAHSDMSYNVPLTENGKLQATYLTGTFDLVICSTMRRTRETLDNSNIKYSEVIFTNTCRERLDGNPSNYYNGEELRNEENADFYKRIEEFKVILKEAQLKYEKICVITHYSFLYTLTGYSFNNVYYYDNYKL